MNRLTAGKTLLGIAAMAMALLLGLLLGRRLADERCPDGYPDGVGVADSVPTSSPPVAPGMASRIDTDEMARLRRQLEKCEAKTKFLQVLQRGCQYQLHGSPVPWSDSIPPRYREEQFQAILGQVLDELEAAVELVGFDCREPPCVAVMRNLGSPGQKPDLARSKMWMDSYGTGFKIRSIGSLDCGDGREEEAILLVPVWGEKTEGKENRLKRLRARCRGIWENWRCSSP